MAPVLARPDALAALSSEAFDVVVVGGGITGAGVALDAAARGYSVALVERADFASGASSRSSKMVHGGLRYLQHFDLGLVREALLERQLLVRLAPHLVAPLALVVAAFDGARLDRMFGIGLNLYDVMALTRPRARRWREAAGWAPDRHRIVDGDEVARLVPALAARRPTSGYLFHDCQTDDVRLVLAVLAEAERRGAVCANRLEVTDLVEEGGRVRGVRVRDREGGEELRIEAARVVNATGVWADRLRPAELHDEAEVPRIRPNRGTHLVVRAADLPVVAGAMVPAPGKRLTFALPWQGATLIGTTDADHDGDDLDHVRPEREDVAYLLDATNAYFATALTPSDVVGAFAGVRPLISTGDARRSVDISRKAQLYETSGGMITITGGKLTTWRRMAKLAVDRLVERDGRRAPCRTHEIALGAPIAPAELPRVAGVPEGAYARLAARHDAGAAREVLALAAQRPELAEPIVPGGPADLLAEAVHAARREQAVAVGDVLLRRTRVALLAAREAATPACASRVAAVMGAELGWDPARVEAEARAFLHEAGAEGIVLGP
jgi:glycerol-3-phosphate dehydrogenase